MRSIFCPFRKAFVAIVLIAGFGFDSLATDPLYVSPFGNSSYYKKRSSEKDFSFSPGYDFSMQYIRLGSDDMLRVSNWPDKTSTERLATVNNKLSSGEFYLTSKGQTRLLLKEGRILATRTMAAWTCPDPETGIELRCSALLTDTVFAGVQKRGKLTVLKKGKGLAIKEVYLEGFGLMVLVINNVIYTQVLSDYDVKKDMMASLGYTDPMACLLVNDANQEFFKGRMKELFDHGLNLSRTGRTSDPAIQAALLQDEMKLRSLAAAMTRVFAGTDYAAYSEKYISYSYSLLSGITLASLQTDTKDAERPLIVNAHHQRLFMLPGVDFIDNKFLSGDAWVKQQQNYCRSIQQLVFAMTDSLHRHPFYDRELIYLYELNNEALKTTWKDHPREKLAQVNQFLLEWILALTYRDMAAQATEPYYKNAYTKKSLDFAYSSLRNHAENKSRKGGEELVLDKESETQLVSIIQETGGSSNAAVGADNLWLLMCRLQHYDKAFQWFKTALPDYSIMYSEIYLPELKAMASSLNNAELVCDLIAGSRPGNEQPETARKALVFLYLDKPERAIELVKNVKWGSLDFFDDENYGQKLLRTAHKNKQQVLLDFFYAEITGYYNLSKTPKKQYNPDTYERLVLFSKLTEEFGNYDLSHKLYEYYQAMWKYR